MYAKQLYSSYGLSVLPLVFTLYFAPMAPGQDVDQTNSIEHLRDSLVTARQLAKDAQAQITNKHSGLEAESLSTIGKDIAAVDQRIKMLAATIHHVNLALAAGRTKDQILMLIKPAVRKHDAFSLQNAPKSDTLRMLNPYLGSKEKPELEENSDVDSQFCDTILDIASRLAGENLRKLELLEQKRQRRQSDLKPNSRIRSLLEDFDGLSQEIIETLETIQVQASESTEPSDQPKSR